MTWQHETLEGGNVLLMRMEVSEKWGAWGQVELTPEQFEQWKAGKEDIRAYVWDNLK